MRTGPKLKGKHQPAPGGHRSGNNESMGSAQKLRGLAVPATQGRTRNQPNTSSGSGLRVKVGSPVANSAWANTRTAVHPKFDTKGKHD